MRRTKQAGIGAVLLAALGWSTESHAQTTDDFPPLPNVLLLVDTSGSMEYNLRGYLPNDPADVDPISGLPYNEQCVANAPTVWTSRWMELIQVLTGTVNNMRCLSTDRQDTDFVQEFTFEGERPYDEGYNLPYHRAVTPNSCMYTASTVFAANNAYDPNNMLGWGLDPFATREVGGLPATACATSWTNDQLRDGIVDTYQDRVRFGLFTFDARPNAGTGATASGLNVDAVTGFDGHFSYFNNWEGAGTPAQGNPPDCDPLLVNSDHEVGARNPSAPPWEGRMINHGPVFATQAQNRGHNDRIQDTLLSLRPYGATPLAGMLDDARFFIRQDDMMDGYYNIATGFPTNERFAPAYDPLLNTGTLTTGSAGNCRKQYIIVLSDGEPNLDMRPFCTQPGTGMPVINGACPYQEPWEIAQDLHDAAPTNNVLGFGTPPVDIFVIGFGIGDAEDATMSPVDCEALNNAGTFDTGNVCPTATGPLAACCQLGKIAWYGGTVNAYFADDVPNLKSALATILDSVIVAPTSRTVPSFINTTPVLDGLGANVNADAISYEFASAFTPQPGELWKGGLERKRWTCALNMGVMTASIQPVDDNLGDDFAANVHVGGNPVAARRFITAYTAQPPSTSPSVQPTWTIRPVATAGADGAGDYGQSGELTATTLVNAAALVAAAFAAPSAMLPAALPPQCTAIGQALAPGCAQEIMKWNLGYDMGVSASGPNPTRIDNLLGGVYHSSPRVIGPPRALSSDPSYAVFQANDSCSGDCALNAACSPCVAAGTLLKGPRPLVMYVPTVDGQLHAFKVAASDASDTAPAASLANNEMWSFIPPYVLPSIRTMYPNAPANLLDGKIVIRDIPFERTQTDAEDAQAAYRTVLVGSGGIAGGYYYALDVTRPERPTFLWQLSTNENGAPLFGAAAGEPAVGMVPYDDGGGAKEIAVAILPGGEGTPTPANPGCAREVPSDHIEVRSETPDYVPRGTVRCFVDGPSMSVTIVRLSDGEILRQFRRNLATSGPVLTAGVAVNADIDEPLLGAVTFPNGTGQVSTRAYLSGQDGGVYRIGFEDADPDNWTFDLMFDAYPFVGSGDDHNAAQPVSTLPSVSTDEQGNSVLVFSTGDQEDFRSTTTRHRVWSITEYPVAGLTTRKFEVESNWYIAENAIGTPGVGLNQPGMNPGEKVTGPIATFGGYVYFSTLTPPPADQACLVGEGRIWATTFLGHPAAANKSPLPGFGANFKQLLPDGENPFGVAVAAEPSCRTDAEVTDSYLGTHATAVNTARANYVVRFFTGSGGASGTTNSNVNIRTVDIPEPDTTVTIDSWASIVE